LGVTSVAVSAPSSDLVLPVRPPVLVARPV
jgi:hypothetical protein